MKKLKQLINQFRVRFGLISKQDKLFRKHWLRIYELKREFEKLEKGVDNAQTYASMIGQMRLMLTSIRIDTLIPLYTEALKMDLRSLLQEISEANVRYTFRNHALSEYEILVLSNTDLPLADEQAVIEEVNYRAARKEFLDHLNLRMN